MITWVKPSGAEMTVNDLKETTAYMESLGYKRKEDKKAEKKPKKGK